MLTAAMFASSGGTSVVFPVPGELLDYGGGRGTSRPQSVAQIFQRGREGEAGTDEVQIERAWGAGGMPGNGGSHPSIVPAAHVRRYRPWIGY